MLFYKKSWFSQFALGAIIVLCALILRAPTAHAASVVWSAPAPTLSFTISSDPQFRAWVYNPMVNVQYSSAVTLVDAQGNTIRSVACGATIPTGSRVKFSFVPQASADISWFGTGSAQDSPYGDWVAAEPRAADRCAPKNLYAQGTTASHSVNLYGALAIAPPVRSIAVSSGNCQTQGSDKLCTLTQAGSLTAKFHFAPTSGQFWGGMRDSQHPATSPACSFGAGGRSIGAMQKEIQSCVTTTVQPCASKACGGAQQMSNSFGPRKPEAPTTKTTCTNSYQPYTLSVPARHIACDIKVVDAVGTAPTSPTLGVGSGGGTGTGSGSGSGSGLNAGVNAGQSCVVGTAYAITMVATDKEGNNVRYGIDWNNDNLVDQFVPAQGYVPSGITQKATRIFSTAGSKTVRVYAEDTAGLASGWASITFNCSPKPNAVTATMDGSDADDTGLGGAGSGGSIIADLSIRAVPSVVHSGSQSKISWSATHVKSCRVTATNGDTWNALTSVIGGNPTQPIRAQTIYTLACVDSAGTTHTSSATVSILPNFQEK